MLTTTTTLVSLLLLFLTCYRWVAANKFNIFVQDVGRKVHNLNADSLKVFLTNTAPNAADTVFDTTTTPPQLKSTSNAPEMAAGSGYSAGGTATANNAYSQTGGTATLVGDQVVFTASGGTIGPFRYVGLYNNTAGTTSTRAPILWWDYTSSITLADTETFTVKFNGSSTGGSILTIA